MPLTRAMKEIEEREGKPIAQVLTDLYETHGSQTEVAERLGINQGTLSMWLIRLQLQEKKVLVRRDVAS